MSSIRDAILKTRSLELMVYEVKWHKYLRKWRKEHKKARDSGDYAYHASSLTDKNFCLVKAVIDEMTYRKKEEALPPKTLSIFLTGIDIHKKHQKFYVKEKIAYGIEVKYYSEFLHMTSTPDAIIKFMNFPTIAEIKSMSTYQFQKLSVCPIGAYAQAQLYMYMAALLQAIVVVEDKNNQELKVFLIKFDLNYVLKFIKRRRAIMICLEKSMIPLSKRICKRKNEFKRCKFNDICFDKYTLKNIKNKYNKMKGKINDK